MRSTSGRAVWLSVVTKQHKLVLSTADDPWLIDLQADPNEVKNRFGQPDQQVRVRELIRRLLDYAREHNDPYVRRPQIREDIEAILVTN